MAYSGTNNSNKLKNTLSELESALADWDKIPIAPKEENQPDFPAQRKVQAPPEVPDEMKRRTKELLDRLKQQIDEL